MPAGQQGGQDHYQVLGLQPDASPENVKKAFRKLARIHHPDVGGQDGEAFKAAREAYEVLDDPNKRKAYDLRRWRQGIPPDTQFFGLLLEKPEDYHLPKIVGNKASYLEGFEVTSPFETSETYRFEPRSKAGTYRLPDLGRLPLHHSWGRRGDLVVDYEWPDPIRGDDIHLSVTQLRRDRGAPLKFDHPATQEILKIRAKVRHETFEGKGEPGAFGGPPGDLFVTVVENSMRRKKTLASRLLERFD